MLDSIKEMTKNNIKNICKNSKKQTKEKWSTWKLKSSDFQKIIALIELHISKNALWILFLDKMIFLNKKLLSWFEEIQFDILILSIQKRNMSS